MSLATKSLTNNQLIQIGLNYGKAAQKKNNTLFSNWKKLNNWNNLTISQRQQFLITRPWRNNN